MKGSSGWLAVAVIVVVGAIVVAEGQNIPSCASKLVPCSMYLNSTTKPPSSCCDPMKEAVTKELQCLCNLYNNPTLLKSFGINVTAASGLPTLCGIPSDQSACPGTNGSPPSSSSGPASSSGSQTPSKNNSKGKTTSTWIFSFFLIGVSLMFI